MVVSIGVLASGRGTNLQSIIDSIREGRIRGATIGVVISDRVDAKALQRARDAGIPAVYIDPTPYKGKRKEFDGKVIECLKSHGVSPSDGLVVLAGYMRILGEDFVNEYKWRIMNMHPALLPSFPGLEAQRQALEYGAKVSGCTVHMVDAGVDTGPIVLQAAVPVLEDDTPESLAERILKEEHRIYPEAVRLFAEGKLRVDGRRVKILP